MDEPLPVAASQRVQDGRGHRQGPVQRDATGGGVGRVISDQLAQRAALDVLHHHVLNRPVRTAVLAAVVHADDVRVAQRGHRAGLAAEALTEGGIAGQIGVQCLDRDGAPQHRVVRTMDGCHPALAQGSPQDVAALPDGMDGPGFVHVLGLLDVSHPRPRRRPVRAHRAGAGRAASLR